MAKDVFTQRREQEETMKNIGQALSVIGENITKGGLGPVRKVVLIVDDGDPEAVGGQLFTFPETSEVVVDTVGLLTVAATQASMGFGAYTETFSSDDPDDE